MPYVKVKENEPFDVALRRFKRSCEKAGILAEVRRREFYEKPTSVRKRKAAAAVKRHAKKVQRSAPHGKALLSTHYASRRPGATLSDVIIYLRAGLKRRQDCDESA